MATVTLREGFRTVTPYLLVSGAERLLAFLTQAFDAVPTFQTARPDGGIRHAEVRIGDSMVMLAEGTAEYRSMPGMVFLYVDDVDATYAKALEAGATSIREPKDESHGDRMCGIVDPVGNQWWIATPLSCGSQG